MRSRDVISLLQSELIRKDEIIKQLLDDNRRLVASALTASSERASGILAAREPVAKKEPRPPIVPIGA